MAKKDLGLLDYSFFNTLRGFYISNKGSIRSHYKGLSKKFLDYNEYGYLRTPQFEALEMYVFLKEFLDNQSIHNIFQDWYNRQNKFERRTSIDENGQGILFDITNKEEYNKIFNSIKKFARTYSNYIFALTMGTGKTILMGTCIFYEFLLANKFPKDKRFCHNALVIAPDKTVLESLRELFTFDKSKVVPPEYVNFLDANIKIYYLDEASTLNTLDGSMFNIIISNSQKIILKNKKKKDTAVKIFFESIIKDETMAALYGENIIEEISSEDDLTINQRFQKLIRLNQLGVYVDEAHHLFGVGLLDDLEGIKATSLRKTIDEISAALERKGSHLVACYNFTGTPYVNNKILPEVVYSYGLKKAIDNKYLKNIEIQGFDNIKDYEFIKYVIKDFWNKYGENRVDGMLPKIAFFAPQIKEIETELKPLVEKALGELGISANKILVNVGDSKLTSKDEEREFKLLDTAKSDKQFILLVNKGREGWNCKSLFSVAMYRKPDSAIFVLQATMRCLRAIGTIQETGTVYLSQENIDILDKELEQNFNLSIESLKRKEKIEEKRQVRVIPPPIKIKFKKVYHEYELIEKKVLESLVLNFDSCNLEDYEVKMTIRKTLEKNKINNEITITENVREKRLYSLLTIVAEISRYLNLSCLKVENILENSIQGIDKILEMVNTYNDLLYDFIIPEISNYLYEIKEIKKTIENEIELIKEPKNGYYEIQGEKELIILMDDLKVNKYKEKSFHVDTYNFDSIPEKKYFLDKLKDENIKKIYFTGMFTHGQSDFYIQYIDPESNMLRKYYPDFLIENQDGSYEIIEVKGNNKIDDPVVKAKEKYAREIAGANKMNYRIIKSNDIMNNFN